LDEQTKDILYTIILKHWQSYLQPDKFDIIGCSIRDFFDMMECYQLADQLKLKKNDSDVPAPKKSCLIHGPDSSHMTNECQMMQEQAYQMKEAWKNISPGERSHQKCAHKK
jgi:hypothetical protein